MHACMQEMCAACMDLLERATVSCVTIAHIACFRPQTPGTQDGPRVWNNQLVRYAGGCRTQHTATRLPAKLAASKPAQPPTPVVYANTVRLGCGTTSWCATQVGAVQPADTKLVASRPAQPLVEGHATTEAVCAFQGSAGRRTAVQQGSAGHQVQGC